MLEGSILLEIENCYTIGDTAVDGGYLNIMYKNEQISHIFVPPPFWADKYADSIHESDDIFNDQYGNSYSIYIWSAMGDISYNISKDDINDYTGYLDFLANATIEFEHNTYDEIEETDLTEDTTYYFYVPKSLALENTIAFANLFQSIPEHSKYIFDFSTVEWIEPFSLIYLSSAIQQFVRTKPKGSCAFADFQHLDYCAHMGFFESCGVSFGKKPNEASGNFNYLPIRTINVEKIKQQAVTENKHIGDILSEESRTLASLLTRNLNKELVDTLEFSLREMLRNAIEHSEAKSIKYCAQFWPYKNDVEIAILDEGIGLKTSLQNNPYLSIKDDKDAVKLSLLPGISGKMFKGVKQRNDDPWQNSGYGLYMTSRICRNGGSFFICSGTQGILLTDNNKEYISTNYRGTALKLKIKVDKIQSVALMLKKIRDDGQKFAKKHSVANLTPSIASTMLSEDFQDL